MFNQFQHFYRMAEECLQGYKTTLNEEEEKLKNTQLTSRQRYCVYVRHGQLKLLYKLMNACSATNGTNKDSKASVTENSKDSKPDEKAARDPSENNTHSQTTEK